MSSEEQLDLRLGPNDSLFIEEEEMGAELFFSHLTAAEIRPVKSRRHDQTQPLHCKDEETEVQRS